MDICSNRRTQRGWKWTASFCLRDKRRCSGVRKDCMQAMMDEIDRTIVIARDREQCPSPAISQDEPLGI